MDDAALDGLFDRAPGDALPAIVPAGQFLIRTERLVVALSHVSVYPNGCARLVLGCARGPGAVFHDFDRLVFTARLPLSTPRCGTRRRRSGCRTALPDSGSQHTAWRAAGRTSGQTAG